MAEEFLNQEDFQLHLGSIFQVAVNDGVLDLTLTEITDQSRFGATGPDGKPIGRQSPFSLVPTGPKELLLPQSLYSVSHPQIGELTLFLKPFYETAELYYYEVVFN